MFRYMAALIVFALLLFTYPTQAQEEVPTGVIVFSAINAEMRMRTYVTDAANFDPVQIGSGDVNEFWTDSNWAPDGTKLIGWGLHDFTVYNPSGYALQSYAISQGPAGSGTFSPDGTQLVFSGIEDDFARLYVLDLVTGVQRTLIDDDGFAVMADWSPDGEWIAYAMPNLDDPAENSIYLIRPDGTENTFFRKGLWPRWSHDGKYFAYLENSPMTRWVVEELASGETQTYEYDPALNIYGLAWSPDNRYLLFATWEYHIDGFLAGGFYFVRLSDGELTYIPNEGYESVTIGSHAWIVEPEKPDCLGMAEIVVATANARNGPGTDFSVLEVLAAGDVRRVIGTSTDLSPAWWQLAPLGAWVREDLVNFTPDCE